MSKTTDIRDAVLAELNFDPLVDTANITVKNIDGDGCFPCQIMVTERR